MHPGYLERSQRALRTLSRSPVAIRSFSKPLLASALLSAVAIVSLAFSIVFWDSDAASHIFDTIPVSLAASHSLASRFIAVYHRTQAITGVVIQAGQDRFGMLLKWTADKDTSRVFDFGSLSSRSSPYLIKAFTRVSRSFRVWFEADFDVRHGAAPHHPVRPPDWMAPPHQLAYTQNRPGTPSICQPSFPSLCSATAPAPPLFPSPPILYQIYPLDCTLLNTTPHPDRTALVCSRER